jgi:hypothetical protein
MFKLPGVRLFLATCLLLSGIVGAGLMYYHDDVGFLFDDTPPLFPVFSDGYLDSISSDHYFSRLDIRNLSNIENPDDGVTQYMCGWHSSSYDEDYCLEVT